MKSKLANLHRYIHVTCSVSKCDLAHLEALNFDFDDFLHFLPNQHSLEPLKLQRKAILALLESSKLISRKIWKFHQHCAHYCDRSLILPHTERQNITSNQLSIFFVHFFRPFSTFFFHFPKRNSEFTLHCLIKIFKFRLTFYIPLKFSFCY